MRPLKVALRSQISRRCDEKAAHYSFTFLVPIKVFDPVWDIAGSSTVVESISTKEIRLWPLDVWGDWVSRRPNPSFWSDVVACLVSLIIFARSGVTVGFRNRIWGWRIRDHHSNLEREIKEERHSQRSMGWILAKTISTQSQQYLMSIRTKYEPQDHQEFEPI